MTDAIHCLWDEPGVAAVDWDHVCRELSARDKGLAKVIAAVPGSRIVPHTTHSAFESLAHSIVYQQLSGKAAATIFGRFRALYDAAGELDPRAVLKTPHRRLRSAGLSEAKALAMKDLAAHVTRGAVPSIAELRRLDPDQVVERLTVVRGVGRWTVEMLLLFRLGHPDVLPAHDLGIRKGLARVAA